MTLNALFFAFLNLKKVVQRRPSEFLLGESVTTIFK